MLVTYKWSQSNVRKKLMINTNKADHTESPDLWLITGGKYTRVSLGEAVGRIDSNRVKEYAISEFARYLLNPNPIQIQKKLVGCEIHYHQGASKGSRNKIWQFLPGSFGKNGKNHPEVLMPQGETKMPAMKDGDLEKHLNKLYALLRPYDPIFKGLSNLDKSKISDIIGICEDFGGNRSWLHLRGSIDEKIEYIRNSIFQQVNVILEKAYIADGLFELRGFDFKTFDPDKRFRLLKFFHEGKNKACVVKANDKIDFWIEDIQLFYYMHLLKQSLDTNPKFSESFTKCMSGEAKPLKLLFNQKLNIDYSKSCFPKVYEKIFKMFNVNPQDKESVMNSLKQKQFGISLNYIPRDPSDEPVLCTNLSVMHDIRALDPLKKNLPKLYSEMNKKASVTEAGKYYLLDSIKGRQNVN